MVLAWLITYGSDTNWRKKLRSLCFLSLDQVRNMDNYPSVDPAFRLLECVSHSMAKLDFYFEKLIFIDYLKMTWSRHLFLFYFWRVNKIRKKTLSATPLFWKRWSTKNRIGFGGQVTYREGTVKTVAPL